MNGGFMDVDVDAVFSAYKEQIGKLVGDSCHLHVITNEDVGDAYYAVYRDSRDTFQNPKRVAGFSLLQLPGCCGVALSTGAHVACSYQRKGLGYILNELRKDLSREAGYTVLMCTDVMHNEAQRKILQHNGWKDVFDFVNKRTGNKVAISVVEL